MCEEGLKEAPSFLSLSKMKVTGSDKQDLRQSSRVPRACLGIPCGNRVHLPLTSSLSRGPLLVLVHVAHFR